MDNHSVETAEIIMVKNGYVLVAVDRSDMMGNTAGRRREMWAFETLGALMEELPRIMAVPYEKQINTGIAKGKTPCPPSMKL